MPAEEGQPDDQPRVTGQVPPPAPTTGLEQILPGRPPLPHAEEKGAFFVYQRELAPGTRLEQYEIIRVLGSGGFGITYLAKDLFLNRNVVIKENFPSRYSYRDPLTGHIRPNNEHDLENYTWALKSFLSEAQTLAELNNPGIVRILSVFEANGTAYFAMEHITGLSLDYLGEKLHSTGHRYTEDELKGLLTRLLRILDYLHSRHIYHRDIKPGNIILLADGQVKVSDFGIARVEATSGMTQHGMTVGTPGYMAPEQFGGQEVDRRADLYATGVVLFEALTGTRPFAGRSSSELMYKVLHDPPPRVTMVNPRLPPELNAVLDKALAKAPDERFQDANRFIATLESLRLVELEVTADGSTLIRVAPVQAPEPPTNALPGWDPALLAQAERFLIEILGPVAKVLVRRTALQVSGPSELIERLMAALPHDQDRLQFQRRMRGVLGGTLGGGTVSRTGTTGTSAPASQMSGSLGSFDQAMLETVRRDLAVYLGPIAKVLVKQAAAKARTPQELYQRLAEHIPTAADRTAFLKRIPALNG